MHIAEVVESVLSVLGAQRLHMCWSDLGWPWPDMGWSNMDWSKIGLTICLMIIDNLVSLVIVVESGREGGVVLTVGEVLNLGLKP